MKKIFILIALVFFVLDQTMAQKEYRLAKSAGKLVFENISNLSVEGYDGKDVVFSLRSLEKDSTASGTNDEKEDTRAKGLTALGINGFDNTGIGFNISERGTETFVTSVGNQTNKELSIKLPNTVALSIKNSGWPLIVSDKNSIFLNKIKSEIDIAVQYENCSLTGISGPVSVKTYGGNIIIRMNSNFRGPVTVNSVSGFIDMTIPEDLKADLSMNTLHGTIYADKNLKLQSKQKSSDNITITADRIEMDNGNIIGYGVSETSSDTGKIKKSKSVITSVILKNTNSYSFIGTLNGGGQVVNLKTMYGKIYLRK